MKESDLQRQILEYLKIVPGKFWRNYVGSVRYAGKGRGKNPARGSADILGLFPNGRFVAIEVKRPDGKETDLQKSWREEISRNGGLATVVSSVEDVAYFIRQFHPAISKGQGQHPLH